MPKSKMITDEDLLKALKQCMENPLIPAGDVADVLGIPPRQAKDRLLELCDKGLIKGKFKSSSWRFCFDK
jgi:DNA-binding Lrp family transcriptional regulator